MRAWLLLLGGLLIWTAQFFALYAAASIFPGSSIARGLTLALTLAAATAAAWLFWRARGALRNPGADPLGRWMATIAAGGSGLAFIAILFQGAPALILPSV